MAFADRAGRSRFPARLFSAAEFEFYPATRDLYLDAVLAFFAGSAEQSTNHQYYGRGGSGDLFSGPAGDHGAAWATTRGIQAQGPIYHYQG